MAGSNENSQYTDVVSTIAKRIDGNQVEVRQCTEPEKQLSDLYKKLDLTSPPLKRRRKICVVHFSELKKKRYLRIKELYAYRLQVGLRSSHNWMVSHTTQIRAGIISMACIKNAQRPQHHTKHVPKRQLPGQCDDGEFLWFDEERTLIHQQV